MFKHLTLRRLVHAASALAAMSLVAFAASPASAQSGEPIKIGFSMSLTGGLAANGKQALLGMQIWEEQTNKKGGLLGRPVKLIYYDDQTQPATVPGIYTKLIDVDKVDLVIGPYATNMAAPAMPVIIPKGKVFVILFGLDVNAEFKYQQVLRDDPDRAEHQAVLHRGLLRCGRAANSEAADGCDHCRGRGIRQQRLRRRARQTQRSTASRSSTTRNIRRPTTDFAPIVRAIQAANPDLVSICSYPPDSVGMVRAVNEIGFKPKMIGGAMVGLQATVFKRQLGPLLNGWVNYETWVPTKQALNPEVQEFLKEYQAKAGAAGVDPLGYYLGTWGYAYIELLGKAVTAAKTLNDDKIAEYIRNNAIKTIMGDIRFGKNGEWAESGMMQVQYHSIKGNDLEQFRGMDTQTVAASEEVGNRQGDLSVREGEAVTSPLT